MTSSEDDGDDYFDPWTQMDTLSYCLCHATFGADVCIERNMLNCIRHIGAKLDCTVLSDDHGDYMLPCIAAAVCFGSVDVVRELLVVGGAGILRHRAIKEWAGASGVSGFCYAAMYGSPVLFAEVMEHADMDWFYCGYFPDCTYFEHSLRSCLSILLIPNDDIRDFHTPYRLDDERVQWRVSNMCTLLDCVPHEVPLVLEDVSESSIYGMNPKLVEGFMQYARWARDCKQAWMCAVLRFTNSNTA